MSEKQFSRRCEHPLHEPVLAYLSGIYATVLSVVLGISLGALLFFTKESIALSCRTQTLLTLLRASVIFLSIVIIWHKYTTHNRYVAWPFWWMDPLIPFAFGILEFMLTLQVRESASLSRFSFWMLSLSACGGGAYFHTFRRHRKYETIVKALYREHFKHPKFEKKLYAFIDRFNKVCLWWMLILSGLFAAGAVFSWLWYKDWLEWAIPLIYLLFLGFP